MPFEDFMAMALYDPDFGYYTTGIDEIGGARGDFATSATLGPGLARAIARWLGEERDHHGWTGPVPVIEVGAGTGALAEEILKALGWWGRRQIRYHIVEVSPPLRKRQQSRLGSGAVSWHVSVSEALDRCGGRALVFSNELVDAFPAKWLCWGSVEACWLEVFVRYESDRGVGELFRPLPRDFPDFAFSAMDWKNPPPGQRIEIQPLYQRWLANFSEHWKAGSLLTIDYGGRAEDIYRRRPGGSLRAYRRHERVEGAGVYRAFGRQDLTVDVNFTDLVNWGEELGYETVEETSQAEFLARHGESGDAMAGHGPGEAFRVLLQRRPAAAD